MAFALTKVRAYGVESEEPVNKRYLQRLILNITGANTDTDLDIGDYSGTFWTAVGATSPGAEALKVLKNIAVKAEQCLNVFGEDFMTRQKIDGTSTRIYSYLSDASAGGAAAEAYTVTGLLATDEVISVDQEVDGAGAAVGIISWGTLVADGLTVTYDADPGANAKVRVTVKRTETASTPDAGQYGLAMDGTNARLPNITWNSGSAPTSYVVVIDWVLKDGEEPNELLASA